MRETEVKLSAPSDEALKAAEAAFRARFAPPPPELFEMSSIYYEAPPGLTLRFRRENGRGVAAIKAGSRRDGGFSEREEYELEAESAEEALPRLRELCPAAKEIASPPSERGRIEYARREYRLFAFGAELKVEFDSGERVCEAECELVSGEKDAVVKFGEYLQTLGLTPETRSKGQRATDQKC